MESISCPGCGSTMRLVREPDIATDFCEGCGGLFLDRGELNVLATGISGDIELCSIDQGVYLDTHPQRSCPKCPDQLMRKQNLLQFSDILFDHCPQCDGFFLDHNEAGLMNAELAKLSDAGGHEEIREYRSGNLIRVDRLTDVSITGPAGLMVAQVFFIRITVFLQDRLALGLRITPEKWTAKLAKALGLYQGEDIESGYPEIDKAYLISCNSSAKAIGLLGSKRLRSALESFVRDAKPIFSMKGRLEILDSGVVYIEGPYTGTPPKNISEAASQTLNGLHDIAQSLEEAAA
jgi:Zn-finger nucleic acid-binding protein